MNELTKIHLKNGNSEPRGHKMDYCKKHFQEIYKREPNIQDVARIGFCPRCRYISPNESD